MPIETIPDSTIKYFLIAYDKHGAERTDDPDGTMSERVAAVLRDEPVTDVFIMSHGWKGDVPAAREQYNNWIRAMATCTADVERIRKVKPDFRPLIVGFHWPSLPFGDESLGGAASFGIAEQPSVETLVETYADRIADTDTARGALRTIFGALGESIAHGLPSSVKSAYETLAGEANLGGDGPGAAPGADQDSFDPDRILAAARSGPTSFGGPSLGGLLSPLRQLSFWSMKDRGRDVGESGGVALLDTLQGAVGAGRDVSFHLMGHSFGCIVVSSMLRGKDGGAARAPVASVSLVQGALSLWSYCSDIPVAKGTPGFFHPVVANGRVSGPLITTQSRNDTAVRRLYPLGAGARGDVAFAPGELPKYGGVGTFGAQGPGITVEGLEMLPVTGLYPFEKGGLYNIESSQYIRGGGGLSGAHNEITAPEVAHAVWEAARCGIS